MKKYLSLFIAAMLFSAASAFAQGGTTGSLTWNITNGTLTISGEGDMPNYEYPGNAPWYNALFFLESVVMENGITSIGSFAFTAPGCSGNSTSFSIPNSVTSIGEHAFYNCCNLKAITIPESVKSIGAQAFAWCQNLTSITIPNSVTSIGESAFRYCNGLNSVTILGNISSIEDELFYGCISLTSITIPNGVTSIGEYAFYLCLSLTSITIPNSVISIGDHAFAHCHMASIIIPDGVISIGNYAFYCCINATSVFIPESVQSIGHNAFGLCEKLDTVFNRNPVPVDIEPNVFYGINLSQCKLEVPIGSVSAYKEADVWKDFNIKDIFLVGVSANNEELGTATGGGIYEGNKTVTVTATANDGYKFVNWTKNSIEVSTDNPYSFTVTEDVELVANFKEEVGAVETRHATSLQVHPNPTTGELRIKDYELGINDVVVFDVTGKKLSSHHLITSSSHPLINISHLPAGIYFVKIHTEAGEVVKKVMKE